MQTQQNGVPLLIFCTQNHPPVPNQKEIFAGVNISPLQAAVFSPDSKYLAALVNFYYKSKPGDSTYSFYTQDLYVLSLLDQTVKKITNSPILAYLFLELPNILKMRPILAPELSAIFTIVLG